MQQASSFSPKQTSIKNIGPIALSVLFLPLAASCKEAAAEAPPPPVPAVSAAEPQLSAPGTPYSLPDRAPGSTRGAPAKARENWPHRAPDRSEHTAPPKPPATTALPDHAAPQPAGKAGNVPSATPISPEVPKDTAHGTAGSHAPAPAAETAQHPPRVFPLPFVHNPNSELPIDRARAFLRDFVRDNASYMRTHDATFFKPFADVQRPRATIVMCSDSRVQSHAVDRTPENDLFTVRNIGNQIASSEGSVEYGIEHLKTPLLIILGHFGCGAVKAALSDHSHEPIAIRHEVDQIDLSPIGQTPKSERPAKSALDWKQAVLLNVHHQVAIAMAKFEEALAAHRLIIVGAVYDFRNDSRQGPGTLQFINVNGNTDPAKISAFARAIESEQAPAPPQSMDARSPAAAASAAVAAASAAAAAAGVRPPTAHAGSERSSPESRESAEHPVPTQESRETSEHATREPRQEGAHAALEHGASSHPGSSEKEH